MKMLIRLFAFFIMFSTECRNSGNKIIEKPEAENDPDSVGFYQKFKSLYPVFPLQIDTSVAYIKTYTTSVNIDTGNCSSFKLNRVFIGRLEYVLAEVKLNDKKNRVYHLQSGNLKMWVCSLPEGINSNEKILINAYVYDIIGFERVFGYPIIISKIYR